MSRSSRFLPAVCLAAATLVAAFAAPASASAAVTGARAELDLDGPAARQLERDGARVTVVRPADKVQRRLRLPVSVTVVGTGASSGLSGSLSFRAGKRSVAVSRLRVTVGAGRRITVTGWLRGDPVTVLTGTAPKAGFALDRTASTAAFAKAGVTLSRDVARTLRRLLRLRHTPTSRLGTLGLIRATGDATVGTGSSSPSSSSSPGAAAGGGSGSAPSAAGPQISSGPITDETPPLARPATAVDVVSSTVTWRVRDSWIQYIAAGNPSGTTGTTPSGGAFRSPASQQGCSSDGSVNTALLTYQFGFAFQRGWYDPASQQASLTFAGAVNFRYPSHGIDLSASDPEIQVNGAASKLVFGFSGSEGTDLGGKRGTLTDLKVDGPPAPRACAADAAPTLTANPAVSGTTRTYERIPGTIPGGTGASVFAGFYPAGAPFGWLTVSFTTGA